jgi:AraC-like DNA-binding protein
VPEPILSRVLPVEKIVAASPLVCAGLFRCHPHHPLFPGGEPCSSFCIVFPREVAWIQHEGGPRFVADSSVATLYNQGQVYRRWPVGDRPDRCDWLAFRGDLLRDVVRTFDDRDAEHSTRPLRFSFAPVAAGVYAAQRRLFETLERGRVSNSLEWEEQALALLEEVLRSAYAGKAERTGSAVRSIRARECVEHARLLLARHPDAHVTLTELAAAVGLSPFHLCREFRAVTGTTISQYRTQLRLRASLERVAAGEDLTTVALSLGFVSHSHFTHTFKRSFGTTPSIFRTGGASATEGRCRPQRPHLPFRRRTQ